jgi:hypothetical protein
MYSGVGRAKVVPYKKSLQAIIAWNGVVGGGTPMNAKVTAVGSCIEWAHGCDHPPAFGLSGIVTATHAMPSMTRRSEWRCDEWDGSTGATYRGVGWLCE